MQITLAAIEADQIIDIGVAQFAQPSLRATSNLSGFSDQKFARRGPDRNSDVASKFVAGSDDPGAR